MKTSFFLSIAALWPILLLSSCRSTPVAPQGTPESSSEAQQSAIPDPTPPAEIAKQSQVSPIAPEKPPEKVIARHLPESLIAAPARDLAARRVEYNTVLNNRPGDAPRSISWRYRTTRQGRLVGFEFSNHGGNRILPPRRDPVKNQFFARDFQFRFDDRARQDIHLMVSDWVPARDRVFRLSDLLNSLMLFFPRTFLPAIVNLKERNIVTLPTGEEVEFNALTHEVTGGALSEAPVDLNPDRGSRGFPAVEYRGKGIVIRADSRGADPRLGSTAVITTGTPPSGCDKGLACNRCEVKPPELWEQSGAARFKYATDGDFERFLVARCGFGLPRIGSDIAAATPPHGR